ncbi:MAG: hypothetical protein ACRDRU_00180 [Pseudonocardiaceae bacterium]
MRITVMTNMAKSVQPPPPDPDLELSTETATKLVSEVRDNLRPLKWFLWHGNIFRALQTVDDLTANLETLHPESTVNQVISRSIDRTTARHADMVMLLARR